MSEAMPEVVMRFIEAVYRETGVYPTEIALPFGAWVQVYNFAKNICRTEAAEGDTGGAIVLAQGTKIRLATERHGEEKT